ncbi:MAG: hypothetical protein IPM95_07760 [Sphingobacteriales bacterium]|nr:hypothetical protein [Sphingobacteriales bacterium]
MAHKKKLTGKAAENNVTSGKNESRRDFFKKTALLGLSSFLVPAVNFAKGVKSAKNNIPAIRN